MNKLYNTQKDISSNINSFLLNVGIIKKTQLKIISFIVIGMILSESVVISDIAKKLKDDFSFIQHDSIIKRIHRFFHNKLFNIYHFYDLIINHIINNFVIKHLDNIIYITFDHMFVRNHFTVLMFTLRIGKQSIPLWFRCFKGKSDPDAFSTSLIKDGINYCTNLFKHLNAKIIFLADRGFQSVSILSYIQSKNCFFAVRAKANSLAQVLVFDRKEQYPIWKPLNELTHYVYKPAYYSNIIFTMEHEFTLNIAISPSARTNDEPWFILTNLEPNRAIRAYSKRFGAIEFFFKSQKSNGFNLECTALSDVKAFETMYGLCCFSSLFLNILGVHYCKNQYGRQYKHVKIENIKNRSNKSKDRIRSYFEIGLILFNKAYSSNVYIFIPFTFKLYDV